MRAASACPVLACEAQVSKLAFLSTDYIAIKKSFLPWAKFADDLVNDLGWKICGTRGCHDLGDQLAHSISLFSSGFILDAYSDPSLWMVKS